MSSVFSFNFSFHPSLPFKVKWENKFNKRKLKWQIYIFFVYLFCHLQGNKKQLQNDKLQTQKKNREKNKITKNKAYFKKKENKKKKRI